MAPIRLPCLVGGECNFQTVQLEYDQAKPLLDGHMQYAHGDTAGVGSKKPEKFPRPEIKMDSSAEDWAEFEVEWDQYKEEYTLADISWVPIFERMEVARWWTDSLKVIMSSIMSSSKSSVTRAIMLRLFILSSPLLFQKRR